MQTPAIVFLHGALGSHKEWEPVISYLNNAYNIINPNLPGHGGELKSRNGFTLDSLVQFLNGIIVSHPHTEQFVVCGHSLGGYMALETVLKGNKKIAGILTLGTKMHWSPEIAAQETVKLNPEIILEKIPHYAQMLENTHGKENWKTLVSDVANLLHELGNENPLAPDNVAKINIPCRFMLGDRDQMVSRDETLLVQAAVQGSALSILPDTAHPLSKVNPQRLAFEIRDFMSKF